MPKVNSARCHVGGGIGAGYFTLVAASHGEHARPVQYIDKTTMTAELAIAECKRCGNIGASMNFVRDKSPHFARMDCQNCGAFIDWISHPESKTNNRRRKSRKKLRDRADRCEICLRHRNRTTRRRHTRDTPRTRSRSRQRNRRSGKPPPLLHRLPLPRQLGPNLLRPLHHRTRNSRARQRRQRRTSSQQRATSQLNQPSPPAARRPRHSGRARQARVSQPPRAQKRRAAAQRIPSSSSAGSTFKARASLTTVVSRGSRPARSNSEISVRCSPHNTPNASCDNSSPRTNTAQVEREHLHRLHHPHIVNR